MPRTQPLLPRSIISSYRSRTYIAISEHLGHPVRLVHLIDTAMVMCLYRIT